MKKIAQLIKNLAHARSAYLIQIRSFTEQQAVWKPEPAIWNAVEITEHLYWAEFGGLAGMWKTLYAIRSGELEKTYDAVHKNLSIEEIISKTWQPKEQVPPVAAPRMGGTLVFWATALESLHKIAESLGNDLHEDELRLQAQPHPISGPLDFHQRLEFLQFHIDRHRGQASELFDALMRTQ